MKKTPAVPAGSRVVRVGDSCYVRARPSAASAALGLARRGDRLPYGGQTAPNGWLSVLCGDATGWVSGKYGEIKAIGNRQ